MLRFLNYILNLHSIQLKPMKKASIIHGQHSVISGCVQSEYWVLSCKIFYIYVTFVFLIFIIICIYLVYLHI